jgi:hypothetical protein
MIIHFSGSVKGGWERVLEATTNIKKTLCAVEIGQLEGVTLWS